MADDVMRVIECRGDPRAMGEAQGRALRETIRACVLAHGAGPRGRSPYSLRAFTSGRSLGSGMAREIARHYPHLSERIQGLARGADLPIAALMEAFVREVESPSAPDSPMTEAAAVVRREGGHARLTRRLGESAQRFVVRRSEPQVGFDSVEITSAWLATAVAGVNEAGVAVVAAPRAAGRRTGNAPAASLLIQECLQRFDSLEGCIDWTLKRPSAGHLAIGLADESGRAAVVEFSGSERNVSNLPEGLTAAGGKEATHAALLASGSSDVDWPKADANHAEWIVCVEPALRRLRVLAQPSGTATEFAVSVT